MDWFLYDNSLRHERVNLVFRFTMLLNECIDKITLFHRLLKKPKKTQCLQCNSFFEARTKDRKRPVRPKSDVLLRLFMRKSCLVPHFLHGAMKIGSLILLGVNRLIFMNLKWILLAIIRSTK